MRKIITLVILCGLALCWNSNAASAQSQAAEEAPRPEVFTGTVIGIGGRMGGVSRTFTLTINGYTSDEEAKRLLDELKEFKQDGLLKAVKKLKMGRVSVNGQTGKDVNVIRASETEDGKRRIVLLFERWINMYELREGTRSRDYPFSIAELYLDKDGKGTGSFIAAARIKFVVDKKTGKPTVELENFGMYPAHVVITKRN